MCWENVDVIVQAVSSGRSQGVSEVLTSLANLKYALGYMAIHVSRSCSYIAFTLTFMFVRHAVCIVNSCNCLLLLNMAGS